MRHLIVLALAAAAPAQVVLVPYNVNYSYVDLGTVAGIPGGVGGLAFLSGNSNTLLIGGNANQATGALYAVPVTRDSSNHINSLGTPVQVATAPNDDGGLAYGPGNVLFFTQYANNGLGQIKPTSTAPDKLINLGLHGVNASVGGCAFVPTGYVGAGRCKLASRSSGDWYDVALAPDLQGTYDITAVTPVTNVGGGPEGILYPGHMAVFINYGYVLICEHATGQVAAWNVDSNGDPMTGTRQVFLTGFNGVLGAARDPVSSNFLFASSITNRIIQVRSVGACGATTLYGQGGPGTNNLVPTIGSSGCPRIGAGVAIQIGNGLPSAFGVLAFGFQQTSLPFLNFHIYNDLAGTLPHTLNGSGTFQYLVVIPPSAAWANLNLYWQAGYLDPGAPQGFSATQGMQMFVY